MFHVWLSIFTRRDVPCSQTQTCSFTTRNNAVITSSPSVRMKNGFHSANIHYKVWTWRYISIVLFTIKVLFINIVTTLKKQTETQTFHKDDKLLFLCKCYGKLQFTQPWIGDNVSAPRKIQYIQSHVKQLISLQDIDYSWNFKPKKTYFNVHQPPLDQFPLTGFMGGVKA